MKFFDRMLELGETAPEKVALRTTDPCHALTFGEVHTLSGQVYAWLSARGIGTEDFVLIHMPRSIETIAVMLGGVAGGLMVRERNAVHARRPRSVHLRGLRLPPHHRRSGACRYPDLHADVRPGDGRSA